MLFVMIFSINVYAAETEFLTVTLNQNNKQVMVGTVDSDLIKWSYTYATGNLTDYNLKVYDVNNNLVAQGLEGQVSVAGNAFPLMFILETNSSDFRIDFSFKKADAVDLTETNGKLDDIKNKLDIGNGTLGSILGLLDDENRLDNSMHHLRESFASMAEYAPLNTGGETKSQIGGINIPENSGSISGLPSLNVTFAPGITKNVFDLSRWGTQIAMIRALMVAILYFSLFIYLIQVLIPRLKI